MKETGVVRRIDELGRIVIPKEIRKNLKIREGDSIEIYINEGDNIVLKKYSMLNGMESELGALVKTLHNQLRNPVLVCDTDAIIFQEGKKELKYIGEFISPTIRNIIDKRRVYEGVVERIAMSYHNEYTPFIYPLVVGGDVFGAIIVLQEKNQLQETDKLIIEVMASFLINKLEVL